MQTIRPLSRVKSLNDPRIRGISPVGKEKVYGGTYMTEVCAAIRRPRIQL